MYEEMITKQELIDAQVDAKDLEKIINDAPETQVQTRLGRYVWTLSTIEQRSLAKITEWQNAINTIVVNDGVPALAVSNANGKTQQEINDFGGAEWWNKPGGYKLGATVKLANGDIVKSTIANNTVNPNIDMTGWVNPTALQALHNKSSATFTDYLTANEIANSTTIDLAPKLQSIIDAGVVSKLKIPKGLWYFNSPVIVNRNFEYDWDVDATLIVGLNGSITHAGSATLIGKPTANITRSSRIINLANSLQPYDLICIYNPTDYSFAPQRAYYRAGEYLKVCTADSTKFTTYGKPYDDYLAADVDIYKISPIKVVFNRMNIIASNTAVANPVTFSFCADSSVNNYSNIGSKSAGLSLDRCFDMSINDAIATNNSALAGLNYGIAVGNSQNIRINGGNNLAARHVVTFGGGTGICSVPCREILVQNSFMKTGSLVSTGAGDFHGNVANSSYVNCVIDHASVGGRSNSLKGCTIYGRDLDGSALLFAELGGGHWEISNCTLIANNNISSSRGVLDIPFGEDLQEDFILDITNLTIKGSSNAAYYPIKFTVGAAVDITKKIICRIDGLFCFLADHSSFVHANSANTTHAGVIPNFDLSMRNVDSLKKGIYYVHPLPTATSPLSKISLPSQTGSQLIPVPTGNANGNVAGAIISLPYSYPIAPNVTVSVGTDGTWVIDSTFNLKPVTAMPSTNTATQLRFALVSPTALPEKTFKVSWQVGI